MAKMAKLLNQHNFYKFVLQTLLHRIQVASYMRTLQTSADYVNFAWQCHLFGVCFIECQQKKFCDIRVT